MKEMIKHIKSHSTESRKPLICWKCYDKGSWDDLESWGADCAKVELRPEKRPTKKLQMKASTLRCFPMLKNSSDDTEFVKYSEIHNQIKDELKNLKTEKTFDPVTKCYKINSNLPWVDLISVREYDFLSKAEQSECFRHNDSVWVKGNSVTEEINRRLNRKKSSIPIIADGGIRHPGDISKAIVAGADMVMIGSMFTSCTDSPAESVYDTAGEIVKKKYLFASQFNGNIKTLKELIELDCNGLTYRQFLNLNIYKVVSDSGKSLEI